MASLTTFLATVWVDDVPLTVLEGGGRGVLSRRLRLHVVDRALVLTYTCVIGSLTSSARRFVCSFYYDIISDGFSKYIYMIVLVLIGNDEVMHILRHGAIIRSRITVVQARALRSAKHSIRLAAAFWFL